LKQRLLLMLAVLVLAACAGREKIPTDTGQADRRASFDARAALIQDWPAWGFTSRLSLDDGTDGGSGRLDWASADGESTLSFRGALGQGAWRLEMTSRGATLFKADGTTHSAPTVDELVTREIGWQVPVKALQWWVRGIPDRHPGSGIEPVLQDQGQASSFEQYGWQVEYTRYEMVEGISLPTRMEATNGRYRVKLAISRWRHGGGDGPA
jgi:outer membrane lipoprotein LolB